MLVIYGYGKTARELAKMLRLKSLHFFIVGDNKEDIDIALRDGFDAKYLDLTKDSDLKSIGIEDRVKTLFCMHEAYNKNLFVTLSARKLNKNLKIISLAATVSDEKKMILAGANYTVNPYDLGSHRIFRILQKPKIFDVFDQIIYSNLPIEIAEVKVPKEASIIDMQFRKLTLEEEYDVIMIGVHSQQEHDKFYYNTHKIYRKMRQGDILVVIGERKNIEKLKKGISR